MCKYQQWLWIDVQFSALEEVNDKQLRPLEKLFIKSGGRVVLGADAADFGLLPGFQNHNAMVSMDSMVDGSKGIEFHWTLIGTNTKGIKVNMKGVELMELNNGLVSKSQGSYTDEQI